MREIKDYIWEDGKLVGIDWIGQGLSDNLDISKNINLKKLYCQDNQLISLDIGNNNKLELHWAGNTFSAPVVNYNNVY